MSMEAMIAHLRMLFRCWVLVGASAVLCACGGGGGDGPPAPTVSVNFSQSSLSFQAESIYQLRPSPQDITATVSGSAPNSTLYILVDVADPTLVSVGNVVITGQSTGQATVTPAATASVGAGTHKTTLTIRACLDNPTCAAGQIQGSPKTIDVTYTVPSNVRGDVVMPSILPAGADGDIILRGHGFKASTTVSVAATPATVTFVSDTELRAHFAAQSAGTYAVSLDSGATPFSGQLALVNIPAYPTAIVPYPDPQAAVFWLAHDSLRQALIVLYFPLINNSPYRLVRYAYQAGGWVQTQSVNRSNNLKQIGLTPDASKLLVLVDQSMEELDPVSLASIRTTTLSTGGSDPLSFAFANDGNAMITTRAFGSGGINYTYLFDLNSRQTLQTDHGSDLEIAAASGDGSVAFSGRYIYDASTGKLTLGGGADGFGCFDSCTVNETMPATLSTSGDRVLSGITVAGRDGKSLGQIDANGHLAGVINPQGTRAYTFDKNALLHIFDLTTSPINGSFPEIGTPIILPAPAANSQTRMTTALDGKTVFIGAYDGLRIVSLP